MRHLWLEASHHRRNYSRAGFADARNFNFFVETVIAALSGRAGDGDLLAVARAAANFRAKS